MPALSVHSAKPLLQCITVCTYVHSISELQTGHVHLWMHSPLTSIIERLPYFTEWGFSLFVILIYPCLQVKGDYYTKVLPMSQTRQHTMHFYCWDIEHYVCCKYNKAVRDSCWYGIIILASWSLLQTGRLWSSQSVVLPSQQLSSSFYDSWNGWSGYPTLWDSDSPFGLQTHP